MKACYPSQAASTLTGGYGSQRFSSWVITARTAAPSTPAAR